MTTPRPTRRLSAEPAAARRSSHGRLTIPFIFTALLSMGCVNFNMMSTVVPAPELWPSRVDELPAAFADEILTFVVWERFEYVYGEGGEQTLALILAPPKVLGRDDLSRLGRYTRNFSYSRKTVDGTDEGSWERGHRAHGLLLVAPSGEVARFITRDDPPRDFTVTWWPLSTALLSPWEAAQLAGAMQCEHLEQDVDPCSLGPLGDLVDLELLRNLDSEAPPLELRFDDEHRESAARFLQQIR